MKFRAPLLISLFLLAGCPDGHDVKPTDPVGERPPASALERPHQGSSRTGTNDANPKQPPPVDPGPPIGQEETLQPVGQDGLGAVDDDEAEPAPEPEKPKVDDSWLTKGEGAIKLFDGIRLYKDEERLEVKGRVCLKRGPTLELMGCTERGKTHESLLLFQCNPKQLHLALVMIGLKPAPQVGEFGEVKALTKGQKVVLEVTWSAEHAPAEDATAPEAVDGFITRRVEDVIYDQVKKASMPRVGWVFTGSRNVMVPKPPNWDEKHEVYAAEFAGNVAAVYHDPDALLDTPLIEGGDDTVYVAYSDRMPERGTKVVIHLRKWKTGDGPEVERKGGNLFEQEGVEPDSPAPGGDEKDEGSSDDGSSSDDGAPPK